MFINRKHKKETLEKMRTAALGRVFTEEHKHNIKKNHAHSWLGRKHTKEQKEKISKGNKGKSFSKETREKLSLAMMGRFRGKNSPTWKGGKTKLVFAIRSCSLYTQWRKNVFRRDGFKCVHCGDSKGHNLEADHIIPVAFMIQANKITSIRDAEICDALWDISNGRTLCASCHKKTPTYGTKATHYQLI